MRAPVATIVLVGALVSGAACGGKTVANVAPEPKGKEAADTELVEGRGVFVASCQRCHGARGQGLVGPRLAGVVAGSFPNIQNEINLITNGAGQMPSWNGRLSTAEIHAVARYTREVL